jgi:hypothetical protein
MLRHGVSANNAHKQMRACIDEMRTCLQGARVSDGFFSSSAASVNKVQMLDTCYTVMNAYMAKLTKQSVFIALQQQLHTAENMLVASSNCALATLYLAYLRSYQQQDGKKILMTYLDLVFTELQKKILQICKFCA